MIKLILNQFTYSLCAELALLLFGIVFVAVTIRTLATRREVTERQALIVLGDQTENKQ